MGSIPPSLLFQTSCSPAEDEAGPIGALHDVASVGAMRVGLGSDGKELVYLGETTVYRSFNDREAKYAELRDWPWYRLEIKAPLLPKKERSELSICVGDSIVIAQYPYYNGLVQRAIFKPPMKLRRSERSSLEAHQLPSPEEIISHFDNSLTYEAWEQGKWLTAAISKPSKSQRLERTRRSSFEQVSVFGVCNNFEHMYQTLDASLYVQNLLRLTEKNTIKFWPSQYVTKGRPKLQDEVIAESRVLMKLSIEQALAGPHKDSADWIGKAVAQKVSEIYRKHLFRRYRANLNQLQKERPQADPEQFAREHAKKSVFDLKDER